MTTKPTSGPNWHRGRSLVGNYVREWVGPGSGSYGAYWFSLRKLSDDPPRWLWVDHVRGNVLRVATWREGRAWTVAWAWAFHGVRPKKSPPAGVAKSGKVW